MDDCFVFRVQGPVLPSLKNNRRIRRIIKEAKRTHKQLLLFLKHGTFLYENSNFGSSFISKKRKLNEKTEKIEIDFWNDNFFVNNYLGLEWKQLNASGRMLLE